MTFEEFRNVVTGLFPDLDGLQLEQMRALEGLYSDWNSKINVISRKDMDEFYLHHVLHSLAIGACVNLEGTVLDLGTGGGFPGIPLAILFPRTRFTLCDSIGKKTLVASSVARSLGLENVTVVNARAESLPGSFDWVVSRAVTSLDNFLPWVKGKYTKGILYLKGGDVCAEISEAASHRRLKMSDVHVHLVSEWLSDPYFSEKFVLRID